jgi:glycosyltransferase involved in cell wall biosynthesis
MTAWPTNAQDMDQPSMRFSVIIPTFQRRELVTANVAALGRQEFDQGFEVIVVVDGSTDGTGAALRTLQVPFSLTVVEQPNAGSAAARNRGATLARGELLLFLDDDMEAHPRLLAEHDESHRAGAAAVMGHIPVHPDSPPGLLAEGVKAWAEDRTHRLSEPGAEVRLADMLTGQLSVARALFERLMGFDAQFRQQVSSSNADTDFGHRLLNSGCRVVFNAWAISWQKYIVTPRNYLHQWREIGRGDVRFVRKHPAQSATVFTTKKVRKRRRWMTAPVAAVARWVFLPRVARGHTDEATARWFARLKWYEYWRGVAEAGGVPPSEPGATSSAPTN